MAETAGVPVKSAQRTVEMLEFLANNPGAHSLTDLQQAVGYPKSSLYMLLRTLAECGWVETDATGALYSIGVRALLVGTSYIDGDDLVQLARPSLEWLVEKTGETVHLARLDGTDVVYLATRESKHYLRPVSRVGRRLPAYATSLGKALLAERRTEEAMRLVPQGAPALTEHTITDPAALAAELALTRARGYAIDHEENTLGLRCFGIALRRNGPARDAISVSVPLGRLTDSIEGQIVEALLTARHQIRQATC